MERAEIDTELVAANPWWRDPSGWEHDDVQLRAARSSPLSYEPRPLDSLRSGGLYILRGPRRVGKSTALKQLVSERLQSGTPPRSILHISVEGRSARDVTDIIRRGANAFLGGETGDRLWLLDEITGVHGEWPTAIKRLRDQHSSFSEDTVVLTGSSAAKFGRAKKWLGGRRATPDSNRVLFHMPFIEVLRALEAEVPDPPGVRPDELGDPDRCEELIAEFRPWTSELIEGWDTYLRVGGYPQAVAAELDPAGHDPSVLDDALWDVIQGDALEDAGLTDTQTLTILRRLASSLTSLLSVRSVAEKINVHPETAAKRLDALRRSFIAFPVHREQGLSPKPGSQAKWYFADPALTRLASRRAVGQPPDDTALSEQQVALALLRALEREEAGAAIEHDRLLYYRSSTKAEIDFVSPDFPNTCFESKFVDRRWGRAFQTIGASNFTSGIVATRSGVRRHDDGWAMPASLLVYLLGL